MIRRGIKGLRLMFEDFHFTENEDYPEDVLFCLIILKNDTLSCGEWWPYSDEKERGRFIRGTADSVKAGEVKAWLPLDSWTLKEALKDKDVSRISIGSDEDYSVEIGDFHSIKKGEIPQDGQYCFLILHDGSMSGGRWEDGGPYLEEPGFFNHAPAACIINVGRVWAWSALEPRKELPKEPVKEEEPKKEEETVKDDRPKLSPEKKFKYGFEVKTYIDRAVARLRENYPWVTDEWLDPDYRFEIEEENGRSEYIEYHKSGSGRESRTVLTGWDGEMDAEGFISRIVSSNEYHVVSENEVIDEYSVPFYPVEMAGWNLEHYIFKKRRTGDYTVNVQAGDRVTGSSREFGIPKKCFDRPDFDGFLTEYGKTVPGGPFGLYKEDLLYDGQLKAFLGYAERKPHPEVTVTDLREKRVIGRYTYHSDNSYTYIDPKKDSEEYESLWSEVRDMVPLADEYLKKKNGGVEGFYGIMNSGFPEKEFVPWRNYYKSGYYFAVFEIKKTAKIRPPYFFTETVIPGGTYVISEEVSDDFDEVFMRYINTVIPEMGYRLCGGVIEYIDAETGNRRLYFPVKELM